MVTTTSMIDSATVWLPSSLIVLDLEENRQAYNEALIIQSLASYEESVRELEDNDLALIRKATQKQLAEGLEKRMGDILAIETSL